MAFHLFKANFTRGEVSPLVQSRQDADFYAAALSELCNWTIMKYGGVRRRSGTRYFGTTKAQADRSELIPFIFSETQAYVLEFGHQYIRFWTPDGQLLSGTSPYEIASPYAISDVSQIQWVQTNDVMYLACPGYKPQKLSRAGHTNWSISNMEFTDGPYLPINDTATTVTPSAAPATGATITLTASAAIFANTDIGRHFRIQLAGKWSWGIITAFTSTTVVSMLVKDGQGGTGASASWRFGAFGGTLGWPARVSFFESRLTWARTDGNPRAIAFSYSGLPDRYSPSAVDGTVTDAHGMFYEILSGRADEILWLAEAPRLQIGTPSAIRSIGAASIDEALAPRNVVQKLEVNSGTAAVVPVQVGPSTVHAGRFARSIHDLFFDYELNALVAPDVTVLAEHAVKPGVIRLAYAQEPESILWAVIDNGELIGTTFERYEKVIGIHRHSFVNGFVESIATIPDADNKRDILFLQMRREIFGNTVRYIEVLQASYDDERDGLENAFFVDCGATYDGPEVSTVTGLGFLEGEEVDVLVDGAVHPRRTVTGGQITLQFPGSKVHVGIPIDAYGKLLRAPMENNEGGSLGRKKLVNYVIADVYETSGLQIKAGGPDYEYVKFRTPSVPMGEPPPVFTGTERVLLEDTWENEGVVEFRCPSPLPATIRALNIGLQSEP